ncbi:TetR/AcrR family transcriptional regulator [Pseudomonas sp. QL9]|uniref:TetR/AcrR family transcriptional regulator n=1 Tax=Pseudomonas TaxID=286 RepID=UPI0013629844|nr:TetR/AcrR family transcriptional regulator [Pseudomonas knackmussii]
MRYSATHKEETRQRLLDSSAAIAKQGGFANAGVDGLMKAVGLSGGAFYNHFSSKDELFAAIVQRELMRSVERLADQRKPFDRERLMRGLTRYLSLVHVQEPAGGCAIPALGAEIARADLSVRQSAEEALLELQRAWAEVTGSEEDAWALLAQCVGALVLARMMASEDSQRAIIESSRAFLQRHLEESR